MASNASELGKAVPEQREGGQALTTVKLLDGRLGGIRIIDGVGFIATEAGEAGHVVYGPYERWPLGRYRVEFDVALADDAETVGDPVVVTLEVTTNRGMAPYIDRRLLRSQVKREVTTFEFEFTLYESRVLEFRVRSSGVVGIMAPRSVRLQALADEHSAPAERNSIQRSLENEQEFLDGYLRNISGLIHVGANFGQERRYYWLLGLDVVWVEPISEMYEKLVKNTAKFPRQRPINALLADVDGQEVELNIANNNGGSSSIFELQEHAVVFPDITYVEKRKLTTTTLETLMQRERISTDHYQALTLDIEGAELLVLRGAEKILPGFRYVKCEVADFPVRAGSPTVEELDALLSRAGFRELARRAFAVGPGGRGTYWDIVWKRVVDGEPFAMDGVPTPMVADPRDVEGLEKTNSEN